MADYHYSSSSSSSSSTSSRFSSASPTSTCPSTPGTCTPPPFTPNEEDAPQQTVRSKTLWFDDGNLIIHAPPVQFKVYSGLLAARSSVFKDMLAFPPPPEGNETVDGCVVVRLFGDDPRDVRWFLKAILDSSFFEPPPTPTTLPIVRSILRLSQKYDVPYLYTRALAHLATTFPTTLSAWRKRDEVRTIPPVDNTPFATLLLAREFGLDWLVPSVMYCICSHPPDKSLNGAFWKPLAPEGEESEEWERKKEEGGMIVLEREDQVLAMLCRNALMTMQNKNAVGLARLADAGEECLTSVNRVETVPTVPANAQNNTPLLTPNHVPNNNPLNNVPININTNPTTQPQLPPNTCAHTRLRCAEIVASWNVVGFLDFHDENRSIFHNGLCPPCREVYKRECERVTEQIWDALPGLCELQGWGVLEGRRRAEVGL